MQCDSFLEAGFDSFIGSLGQDPPGMEDPQQRVPALRAPKAGLGLGRKKGSGPDRRPLRFWQPFNDWWRGEFDRTGKRPAADDIMRWYTEEADSAWGAERPTLQETRVHAKCLRSVTSVRDYFREYRAKKKTEEEEDMQADDVHSSKRISQDIAGQRGPSPGSSILGLGPLGSSSSLSSGAASGRVGGAARGRSRDGSGPSLGYGLDGAIGTFLDTKPDNQKLAKAGKADKRSRHGGLHRGRPTSSHYRPIKAQPGGEMLPGSSYPMPCMPLGSNPFGTMDSAAPHVGHMQPAAGAHNTSNGLQAAITSPTAAAMGGLPPLVGLNQMGYSMEAMNYSSLMPAAYFEPSAADRLGPGGGLQAGPGVQELAAGIKTEHHACHGHMGLLQQASGYMDLNNPPRSLDASTAAVAGPSMPGSHQGQVSSSHQQGMASHFQALGPSMASRIKQELQEQQQQQQQQQQQEVRQPRPRGRPPGSGKAKQKLRALANIPSEAAYYAAQQEQQQHHKQLMLAHLEWQQQAAAAGMMPPPPAGHHAHRHQQQQQQLQHQHSQHRDPCSLFSFLCPRSGGQPGSHLPQASPFLTGHHGAGAHAGLEGMAGAAGASIGHGMHNQAGILAELESVKGPHIEGLLNAHCAAQQQRISQSALLDPPYDVGGIMRRVSQVGDTPVHRLSLRMLPSADFDLLGPEAYDLLALIGANDNDLMSHEGALDPLLLEAELAQLQQQQQRHHYLHQYQHTKAIPGPPQGGLEPTHLSAAPTAATAAPGSAAPGAAERKRYRSSHRISQSMMDGGFELPKRMRVSGTVSSLLMELDTPKVRALHNLPPGALDMGATPPPWASPGPGETLRGPCAGSHHQGCSLAHQQDTRGPSQAAADSSAASTGCGGAGAVGQLHEGGAAAAAAAGPLPVHVVGPALQKQPQLQQAGAAEGGVSGASLSSSQLQPTGRGLMTMSSVGSYGTGALAGRVGQLMLSAATDGFEAAGSAEAGAAAGLPAVTAPATAGPGGAAVGYGAGPASAAAGAATAEAVAAWQAQHVQQQQGLLGPPAGLMGDGGPGRPVPGPDGWGPGACGPVGGGPSRAILPPMHEIERMI